MDVELVLSPAKRVILSGLHSPVFIVGSPRSGTSILVNALLAAGYHGFREGNFLGLMRVFETIADRHRLTFGTGSSSVLAAQIDWDLFKDDLFCVFKRHMDALNPVPPWMDKSGNPETIELIPHIMKLWPTAVFIFAKRRGIENIISRLKKFPGHNFEYHCRDWAKNMSAWRLIKEQIGRRAMEIDQQEIVSSPGETADKLAGFLNAEPEVRARMTKTFTDDRPQQSNDGSAARRASLETVSWSTADKDMFLELCGPEMELARYSLGLDYWRT